MDNRLSLDEAVEYLTAHPDEIEDAWGRACDHAAGALFRFISPSKSINGPCGCPTMIKGGDDVAVDNHGEPDAYLTTRIRRFRIPSVVDFITVADLPKFAKIQKMVDDYYRERGWRK